MQRGFEEALLESLEPGTQSLRYGRLWRLGRWHEKDGVILGRIGFETGEVTELWNEDLRDFEEAELAQGTTSPFAIDLGSERVAFQRRGGTIKPATFMGALQALLNEASQFERWRVYQPSKEVEWTD